MEAGVLRSIDAFSTLQGAGIQQFSVFAENTEPLRRRREHLARFTAYARLGFRLPASDAIRRNVILGIFRKIHLDKVAGAIDEAPALRAEMRQMQTLAALLVLLGERIDRFQAGLVVDCACSKSR